MYMPEPRSHRVGVCHVDMYVGSYVGLIVEQNLSVFATYRETELVGVRDLWESNARRKHIQLEQIGSIILALNQAKCALNL